MKGHRIIGIDTIRVIAIFMVVIFHSSLILEPLTRLSVIGQVIRAYRIFCMPLGIFGVELFFVLSGYLIGSILIKTFIKSDTFGWKEIRNFLVRRWFRTLPNYWLILILNLVIYSLAGLNTFTFDQLAYFVFIQNWWTPHPIFFSEAWSLAVEEWFYLTIPFAILVVSRIMKRYEKSKVIFAVFVVYATCFLALRIANQQNNPDPLYFEYGIRKIVMLRLDAIAYGVLIAYASIFHREALLKMKNRLLVVSLIGSACMFLVYYAGFIPACNFYARFPVYRLFANTLLFTFTPVFFCLSIPYASVVRNFRREKSEQFVAFFSKISYSMYLVHFTMVLNFVHSYFKIDFTVRNCVPYYIGYWVVVISLSALLYRFFERPIMDLRDRISRKDPTV